MTPTAPESRILEALLLRLKTLVLNPVLPVEWPDKPFDVPADRRYLRVLHLPNETQRVVIPSDGPHRYIGILQLTLVRRDDAGVLPSQEEAGLVAAHFAADTKMKHGTGDDVIVVRSVKRPTVSRSYSDVKVSSDLLTPVSVEYETYV